MARYKGKIHEAQLDMVVALDPGEPIDELDDFHDATALLQRFCVLGHPPAEMILRINHSQYGNGLFGWLGRHYRGTPNWYPFVDAVMTCQADWFHNLIEPIAVGFQFKDAATLDHIVTHFPDLIRNGHPFTQYLPWETYWTNRVRTSLQLGLYRHAFDDLRLARDGFFIGDGHLLDTDPAGTPAQKRRVGPRYRSYPAPPRTLRRLAKDIFTAVQAAQLLPTEPLPTLWKHQPSRPGNWTAAPFVKKRREGKEVFEVYELEGSMIIILAQLFYGQAPRSAELVSV